MGIRSRSTLFVTGVAACLLVCGPVRSQEDKSAAEVRAAAVSFAKIFDSGKAADIVAQFSPEAELIDEDGNLYQGTKELTELFTKFAERFPNAKLTLEVESVRLIGANLAMEEGTRLIQTKPGEPKARLRYTAVRTKANGKWLFASIREFNADEPPTPGERLQDLAWLVGDWVNEGSDGVVKITYRWSEDHNFLLGDFLVTFEGKTKMKSSQRIGWDPIAGKVRSWLFDSDGGFAEGQWTNIEGDWVVKSQTVNPDATSGTATLEIQPKGKGRFLMKGSDRIIADAREPDFEFSIVRQPPSVGK